MPAKIHLWMVWTLLCSVTVVTYAKTSETNAPSARRAQEIAGRVELDAFLYDVSVGNVYVEHPYAAHLSASYHFLDWLSVEALVGYSFVSRETGFTSRIRSQSPDPAKGIELPGLWTSTWQMGGNLVFAPIYGKVSLWSEAQSHFQIYAYVPFIGEGITRIVEGSTREYAARFSTGLAGGARVFAIDEVVVRAEVRQLFGFNPRLSDNTLDIAPTTWLQLGIGYLF